MADTELESLRTTLIATLKETIKSPKPSYDIDGRKFDWNGYLKELRQMLKDIDEALGRCPYEYTQVYIDPSLEI